MAPSRPAAAKAPLIKRTPAKGLAAFMDHDSGKAFHKGGKKAFGGK